MCDAVFNPLDFGSQQIPQIVESLVHCIFEISDPGIAVKHTTRYANQNDGPSGRQLRQRGSGYRSFPAPVAFNRSLRSWYSLTPSGSSHHTLLQPAERAIRGQREQRGGNAPARICNLSTEAMPRKMKTPSPPAPIAAAMVAVPMVVTVGDPQAGDDRRRGQRQFHHAQDLAASHPHRDRRIAHHRVDAEDSRHGVSQDRQKRVKHQRNDRRVRPDAADERDRDQKTEKRKAGDRLPDAGEAQRPAARRAGSKRAAIPAGIAIADAIRMALSTSTRCSPSSCRPSSSRSCKTSLSTAAASCRTSRNARASGCRLA